MTVREEVWPTAAAYLGAVRALPTAFPSRPDLAGGALRDSQVPGFPWSASGANAIVFSLTTGNGHRVAVRCFTRRPQSDVDERYRALGGFLRSNPCPEFAGFEWMESAIIVDAKRWPILQMEWIDGDPLKPFVRNHLELRSEIEQLSETWKQVVVGLDARRVADGDLQHGNVIVSSSSKLRLVDLDGVWCQSTAPFASAEVGLPAYQHPERVKRGTWDHRIDRFSAIVIYVSLRAIASARRPVDILSPGDSLVLSADDIKAAAEQNARDEAWEFLLKSPDREVCLMADELHEACRRRLDDVPSLDEFVRQLSRPETPPPLEPQGADAANRALNTWPPPVHAPPAVDNVWNATGAPTDQDGRRVKVEASHQQSGGAAEPPRRSKPKPVPQSWGGARPPQQPAAGPAMTQGQVPRSLDEVFYNTWVNILLTIVTCGVWACFWSYRSHGDLKRYNGDGLGEWPAFVICIFISPIIMFTVPYEIDQMYQRDGRKSPVSAWSGLWFLLPIIGHFIWYFGVQDSLNDFWASKGAVRAK